uniref:26S proteasome non-ATPase regulatory subunit 4 n=1 Tax=Panagrolaimus sp. JU765 TaxID=591449 RepID=A0AC34QRN9_9BILA
MVQESTMICIDNSEYMRNGDFTPTRLQCEQEAANMVLQCKLRSNPENAVGLLSMADEVKVLSTMTQEDRKLFCKLYEVGFAGSIKIVPAIKVAHLALKHRQNRNHKMRIILFVGSPIEEVDKPEFIKLAKKLKKEKVNVDIVCFGEATGEENVLLQEFVDTLNGKEGTGSNLVVVGGGSTLREALASSPICRADGGTGAPLVNPGGMDFGMDGEEDPELALALRVSLEEQRARQQQESGTMEVEPAAAGAPAGGSSGVSASVTEPLSLDQIDPANLTEEQQLELALRMSVQDAAPAPAAPSNSEPVEAMEVDTATKDEKSETQPEASKEKKKEGEE